MVAGGREWIDSLPDELSAQRRLLLEHLRWCEEEPAVRWFLIGCSLARGNADHLSDLDTGVGADESEIDEVARLFVKAAPSFGDLVTCFDHRLEHVAISHRAVFAQYGDGTQIDLVVLPATESKVHGAVVLYDPEGLLEDESYLPPDYLERGVPVWSAQVWGALMNVSKYLRRGSLWEARLQLEEGRRRYLQLWAVREGVGEPWYGLTSLLDAPSASLPRDLEATVAALDRGEILEGARVLARLAREAAAELRRAGYKVAEDFGRFVTENLNELSSAG